VNNTERFEFPTSKTDKCFIADLSIGKSVTTIGSGFRYLLARKLHTNMGMDFALSNDDFAFYVVFGSAWMK
jgi:hypothetical protein